MRVLKSQNGKNGGTVSQIYWIFISVLNYICLILCQVKQSSHL